MAENDPQNGPVGAVAPSGKPSGAKKITKRETSTAEQRKDRLWQLLDSKIGGKEGLLAAAMSSTNPKAADLIPLILDKAYRQWGTKALCRKVGLTTPEVVDMFRDRKWLEAMLTLHDELPNVVQDAVIDAKASFAPCPECKGVGIDWNKGDGGAKCYYCEGKGRIRRPGDKDKLKFVSEAVGMTSKDGPQNQTNLQINVQGAAVGVSFEDLMKKATLNVGKPKVIDVTPEETK